MRLTRAAPARPTSSRTWPIVRRSAPFTAARSGSGTFGWLSGVLRRFAIVLRRLAIVAGRFAIVAEDLTVFRACFFFSIFLLSAQDERDYTGVASAATTPLPVADFRQVLAVSVDVLLVLDQLVPELLLQVDAPVAGLRQAVDGVDHEVKAVQIVQHRHVEGRGDGALLLVTTDVDVVVVRAAVGQPVDQPRV